MTEVWSGIVEGFQSLSAQRVIHQVPPPLRYCQKKRNFFIFALPLFCLWLPVCTSVDLQGETNLSQFIFIISNTCAFSGKAEQLK